MDPRQITAIMQSAAAATTAGRLIWLGLAGRFRALLTYLVFLAVASLGLGLAPPASHAYFWMYVFDVPLYCLCSILAVRELLALVFDDYPGIRTGGRWAMYSGLAVATAGSLLIAGGFRHSTTGHFSRNLLRVEIAQRSIVFSLAVLIATILFFLSRYPLHLRRNTYVSSAFFSALFLAETLQLLVDSLEPGLASIYLDTAENAFAAGCLGIWALLLKHEQPHAPPIAHTPTQHENELLAQLETLNHLLARTASQQ